MISRRDFFFSSPLSFFPYLRLSSYLLRLFFYLISFLLFACASVWEHSCMSSPFPIAILNGTFARRNSPCFGRSFAYQNLSILLLLLLLTAFTNYVQCRLFFTSTHNMLFCAVRGAGTVLYSHTKHVVLCSVGCSTLPLTTCCHVLCAVLFFTPKQNMLFCAVQAVRHSHSRHAVLCSARCWSCSSLPLKTCCSSNGHHTRERLQSISSGDDQSKPCFAQRRIVYSL